MSAEEKYKRLAKHYFVNRGAGVLEQELSDLVKAGMSRDEAINYLYEKTFGASSKPHVRGKKAWLYAGIIIFVTLGAIAISFLGIPSPGYFVLDPYVSTPLAMVGSEFNVSFNSFPNAASSPPSTASITVPRGLELLSSSTVGLTAGPARSRRASWEVLANSSGLYTVYFKLGSAKYGYTFPVYEPVNLSSVTSLVSRAGQGVSTYDQGVVMKAGSEAIYFAKSSIGYGPAIVLVDDGKNVTLMGVLPSLGSVCTVSGSSWNYVQVVPQLTSWSSNSLSFRKEMGDYDIFSYWYIANNSIFVKERVTALTNVHLLQVSISLYPGALSFGTAKEEALFPGLEWLVKNETSSSTLDAAPPYNLRDAPDPSEVTIPLMALSYGGLSVGLLWDPCFSWNGSASAVLSPEFSVPNWLQGQNDDLFELFAPNVPTYVLPNEDEAFSAYDMPAGGSVAISCSVYAGPGGVLSAVARWLKLFGLPQPELPMTPLQDINYSMKAYLYSLWKPGQGWLPWSTFSKRYPGSGFVGTIYLSSLVEHNSTLRSDLVSRFDQTLPMALSYGGSGYIITSDGNEDGLPFSPLPFYIGYLGPGMDSMKGWAYSYISQLNSSGGLIPWEPTSTTRDLGIPGEKKLGTTSYAAMVVLTFARLTGDKAAIAEGIRALNAMEVFKVPRAGQTWEVPVHAPEIYSDAEAIYDYVLGYQLTGNYTYLREANYWAMAGLPFVYLWKTEYNWTFALYATIPTFGASDFTHPWFGVPVQWNGLAYAYSLLMLSQYNSSFPWKTIAVGILGSAMWQQLMPSPYPGTLPDNICSGSPEGPFIIPSQLVYEDLYLSGLNPNMNVSSIKGVTVATPSTISSVRVGGDHINITLYSGTSDCVFVSGFEASSVTVEVGGSRVSLESVPSVASTSMGWHDVTDATIVKVPAGKLTLVLVGNFTEPY
ncbi:MAG: hypothetical protein ACP5LS_04375 [Thermoprotei archaeon]